MGRVLDPDPRRGGCPGRKPRRFRRSRGDGRTVDWRRGTEWGLSDGGGWQDATCDVGQVRSAKSPLGGACERSLTSRSKLIGSAGSAARAGSSSLLLYRPLPRSVDGGRASCCSPIYACPTAGPGSMTCCVISCIPFLCWERAQDFSICLPAIFVGKIDGCMVPVE
jgi:hypothetical protein